MINEDELEQIVNDTISLLEISGKNNIVSFKQKYLERIDVIDDQGGKLGILPRGLVHRLGLRHTVVYAAIYNVEGLLLVQTRGSGRIDIAVGGHVQAGEEDVTKALIREAKEELGLDLRVSSLTSLAIYNRDAPISKNKPLERNRERRYIYKYIMTREEENSLSAMFKIRESRKEVTGFNWYTLNVLKQMIKKGEAADGLIYTVPFL